MRAALLTLVLTSCSTEVVPAVDSAPPASPSAPSVDPASASTPAPRRLAGLRLRQQSDAFRIWANADVDGARLGEVARLTHERVRGWLGDPPEQERGAVDVCLVETVEGLRRVERELALSPGRRGFGHEGGGYYHKQRLVLLRIDPDKDLEWLLSHEVCHSVFRGASLALPTALNEGLAEVLPGWILHCAEPDPADCAYRYAEYARICRELFVAGEVPALEALVRMPSGRFQADRWRNFSLAWSLARVLVTSQLETLRGHAPALVLELGRSGDAWVDFCRLYDADVVERQWIAALAAM